MTPAVCCARRGDVVMVDTGDLAFRTDVDEALGARGAEVVEVGRAVPASPIVDLRFDVVGRDA